MTATLPTHIPEDWYATAFDAASAGMAWTDRTGPEVDRVIKILQPRGDERILDLACGSGRHSSSSAAAASPSSAPTSPRT